MDPISISICDNNIEYLINKDDNKIDSNGSTKSSLEAPLEDGYSTSKAMFPNRTKYIFEDDVEGSNNEEEVDYENVFIINMNEDHIVEDVNLISDQYQLLQFTPKQDAKTGNELDIEVISKFKDLSKHTKNMSLSKLINIYNIQNKQLASLLDSI